MTDAAGGDGGPSHKVCEMADAPASLNLTCGRNEKGEKVIDRQKKQYTNTSAISHTSGSFFARISSTAV